MRDQQEGEMCCPWIARKIRQWTALRRILDLVEWVGAYEGLHLPRNLRRRRTMRFALAPLLILEALEARLRPLQFRRCCVDVRQDY